MKKVIGFALFFIAVGMLIMLMLPNVFVGLVLIFICLIVGYNLWIIIDAQKNEMILHLVSFCVKLSTFNSARF